MNRFFFAARATLFTGVSASALLLAGAALAQTPPVQPDAAVDDVIVTGTRAPNRSRLDSLAPVDVITAETLRNRGTTELAAALAQTVPSINFPRPSVTDGTDSIRPATLRGLSPDQTLVLVNGTRRHASALVNVNGSVGRGSSAVDLNAIPTGAVDRVEVLRDGASAQYGSDAIAGVVNLRLREAASGGGASVTYGRYDTTVETARGRRDESDGRTITGSVWQGFGLGSDGFLTLSAEYLTREPTHRSDYDPRPAAAGRVTARLGDPEVNQWSAFANAGKPLAGGWEAYGWLGYQGRDSESAAFPRLSDNANNVLAVYPDGFLPLIAVDSRDLSAAAGVRGQIGGWSADVSLVYGRNALGLRTEHSLNATYGAASPTSFDAGALIYDQAVLGADFTREFEIGRSEPLVFSWGVEARRETYEIQAGQPESWSRGPLGGDTALIGGAQGFVGLQPANEVQEDRTAVSAYADVEIPVTDRLRVAGALRFEDYSDFGRTATGKLSARYEVTPNLAIRGTVSTGFRAPSLQQSYFTSTASVVQSGVVVETGTFPATSAVAAALGARPLEPETSVNLSLGAVLRAGPFDLTIDAYQIDIEDQIALSELINRSFSGQVASLLDPFGVQAARFFINGVDTTTQGVDVVARYRLSTDGLGDFDFTLAGNVNDTEVTRAPVNTGGLNPAPILFARNRIETIQQGAPGHKVAFSTDWRGDRFGASVRATHYGDVLQPGTTAARDFSTGAKTVVDLEGRWRATDTVTLSLGVDNVFDEYPDPVPATLNSNGVIGFPFYSPFGFNGRYGYARLTLAW